MSELVNHKAENYVEMFSSPLSALLMENETFTRSHHPKAHMHSGSVQGLFLSFLSRMIKPRRVLDIGTFTGFSALCLAEGLTEDGLVHTIECREEDAGHALAFFQRSAFAGKISLHVGDARQLIPQIHEDWDLVFIDADKVSYIDYYELTLPNLKPGGWIIADNVLFHGQVLDQELKGKNAQAIHAFNRHVAGDQRVEQVMLSIRDGILLIRKL